MLPQLLLVGAATAAPSAAAGCECPNTYPYCWSSGTQHDNRCYKSATSSSSSPTACVGKCTTSYVPAPPPPSPPSRPCECPNTYPYCWNTGTGHDDRCYQSESSSSYSRNTCVGSCTTSYVPATLPPVPPGQVAPMCDVHRLSPEEYCEDFCTNKCSFYNTSIGDTGKPQNITVIRITPKNVTGPANKNTADAPGDVSFVLSKKNLTQMCLHYPTALGCNTDVEVNDMYGTFVLEVDGQWGPYQMCNPADGYDTKDWKCGLNCLHPTHQGCGTGRDPYHPPKNGSSYNGGVQCYCDRTTRAVGREPAPRSYRPYGLPATWPPQCATGVYKPSGSNRVITGTVLRSLSAWDFASASTMACKECGVDTACTGWAINRTDGWTVDLFQGRVGAQTKFGAGAADSATKYDTSHHHYSGMSWSGVGDIGGVWYSHTSEGECPEGAPLGTNGCSWRVVETLAYKNATCVDLKADAAVVEYGKACFDQCPQPLDRNTDCYLDCYRNTLLGDASLNITKPPPSLIVNPWRDALESAESAGGCPDIQPGPLSA